ncbi:MAG: hypothetical protein DHS20C01_32620 [marine bacterium B5-7]|nr:MAG: hypothetical protein DHS20C01_32620 [marine bacterium B5-7]
MKHPLSAIIPVIVVSMLAACATRIEHPADQGGTWSDPDLPARQVVVAEPELPAKEVAVTEPEPPAKETAVAEPESPTKESAATEAALPAQEVAATEPEPPTKETAVAVAKLPTVTYQCESGAIIDAYYGNNQSVTLTYQEQVYRLKIARSASGARYVGDGMQWWTRGSGPGGRGTLSSMQAGSDISTDQIESCIISDS